MQRTLFPGVWPIWRSSTPRWFTALVVGLLLPFFGLTAWAQPTVLGTSIAAGSYATYNLNAVSSFRQVTIQATGNIGAGTGVWEYARGTAASTDYSLVWRPYSAGLTFSGFNNFIPTSASEGAKYNTGSGGSSGRLPAVTSGRYYTFNVANNASADNAMQVLETTFNPVSITTVTTSGTGFQTGTPITVNITTSAAPATGENVYVRYSTNAFASNNNLVQATFSGTSGVAQIPSQAAGTTLTYYVFSSNKSIAQINNDNTTYSTALGYDLATLRLNNNGGANYTYAVNAAVTGNVLVQSSGGTTAITSYGTVGAAFAKINDGTHQGNISVFLNTATITETATSYIKPSGQGAASYTSVTIQPIIDGVTVTGASGSSTGLFSFVGSNITLDGDNPNSVGINRNLTLSNSAASSTNNTTLLRIAGATTPAITASNIVVRNTIITGNGTSGVNSTSPTNTTYGIYAGTDAGNVTAVPSTTISTSGTGSFAGLTISNNLITTCARAIYISGSATAASNVVISGNTLGGTATAARLTAAGVSVANASSPIISGNTIQNLVSVQASNTSGLGIHVQAGTTTPTISGNIITGIQSTYSSGGIAYSAVGIQISNTSPCLIYNNSISGLNTVFGSSNANGDLTYGAFGIRVSTGTGHKIYYNSIYLQGSPSTGTTQPGHSSCLAIASSAQTDLDVRNNIFANSFSAASAANTCLSIPSGLTSAFNLTLNNNAYYAPATAGNYIAQTFTGTATAATYTAANFNAAATSPATNLRSYTSTLSTAGTNDNLSFASSGAVPFTSATNLSIPTGTTTLVESGATPISGITTDLPGTTRATGNTFPVTAANTNPDMGAYEGSYALPAPATVTAISYTQSSANTARSATNQQVTGLNINITGTTSPRVLNSITFNLGSTNVADITNARLYSAGNSSTFATTTLVATTGTIASPSYTLTLSTPATLAAGDNYFFLTYDISGTATSGNTVASTPTTVTVSSTAYTSATTPAITLSGPAGARTIIGPLNGTYTVGQPTITVPVPSYATITAAIADLTLRGVSGPVTFSLINPGTTPYNTANGETFPLNVTAYAGFSAANTVTFKPALLTSPVISNGSATALFKLTDVSFVTIDGSNLVGGTSRDLSLTNTNTASTGLVWIATSGTGLSHDNKVLNLTLQGASNASTNLSTGVMVCSNSYNNIGADNDNITISNNTVQGTYMGIVAGGTAAVSSGGLDGLVISNNIVGPATAATANNITLYGIFVQGAVAPSLTDNTVRNVVNSAAANYGIILSNNNAGITGGTVSGNTVSNVSSAGGSAYGISSTASAATLSANTVSNVSSTSNYAYGLYLGAGSAGTTATATVVDRNKVSTLTGTASGGYTGIGIYVAPGAANANLRISNNFVADLRGTGFNGITNGGIVGVLLNGSTAQSGISLYHNSVSLSGSYTPGTTSTGLITAALAVTAGNTGLDIRNNIFANTLASSSGTSTSYAFYSAAPLSAYTTINYNDYYVSGAQGVLAFFNGGNRATLTALQDATNGTAQDANSVTGNPNFTSTTDLHIAVGASKAESTGVLIAAAGNDVDNQARGPYPLAAQLNGGGTAPDLGADEGDFTPAPLNDVGITALTSPTASQVCYTSAETVTVTLRNFSGTTLNFATNPVTVSGSVSGPINTTLAPVVLNTGTLAAGATQAVTFVTPANMSTAGTYTFAIASSVSGGDYDNTNDALPSTPAGTNTRTPVVLTAGTASASASTVCGTSSTVTLTLTGTVGASSIQWQSSTDNLLFNNISGATTTPYTTAAIAQTTYYKAVVSCGTSSATSNTLTVTVSDPQVTFVNAPSRCGAGTVTLQATANTGNTPYYFTTPMGGAPFASGISATATVAATPATQTFYVEARNGTLNVTGEQSSTSAATGSTFTPTNTTADRALGFNVTSAGVLNSVDVYPSAAGTLTIRLYTATNPGAGTAVSGSDRTFAITAAQVGTLVTLPLNYALAAGGYKLSNSTGGLGRYSTYTGTYPITNGVIAVVGSYNTSAGGSYNTSTYNSFFNLAYTTGGPGCASSPRTALAVTVTTPPALTYTGSTTICSGSSTTLTFSPASYATLTVSPTTGATVNNAAHTVTFNPTANTIYTITGNDGNGPTGCTATTTLTIVVNATPNAPTLTPGSASICAGTSTTVTASSNALTTPTILTQNFNSGLGSWTASNNGGGAATVWGIITPPYTYSSYLTAWNGADGTPLAFANSDAGGSGSATNTLLTSPSFNTTGYTAAAVAFDHLLRVNGSNTTAKVQYSVNGGTWTDLVTYTTSQGTGPTTTTPTVTRPSLTLPAAALNQADVRIRFSYVDAYGYYWALDNVAVTGTINEVPTYTVTPTAGASVSGSTITFNPTATTSYSVTATYPSMGCPSPATPITVTVTPVATANAGTAPAKVCAGYTYSTTGSYGGSATSATYTSSGTGTFSNGGVINATTTSVTYSPSAADITAGAVTLTLTTAGPCAPVTSTLALAINSSSTWTGAANSEWNNAGNWDNCIPNLQVNAIVPAGTARSIGDGDYANSCTTPANPQALAKNLTVASGAYLEIYSHNLSLAGNLSNSGDMYLMFTDGCFTATNLRFVGATAQTAAGMPNVYTMEVANTGATGNNTVTVTSAQNGGSSFDVRHALTMTSGLLDLGSVTTLVISDDMFQSTLTETNTSYVLGAVRAKEYIADNTPTTFSNLGLTLTADAASTTFPNETVVTRTTGIVLNGAGTSQSVKRWFRIVPTNDAGLNVTLKMDLFEHERNGIANANLQLFSAPIPTNGGAPAGPWAPYRASALVAASNASYATAVQVSNLTHLSDWTLGNSANPLPVELTKFEAVRVGQNAQLNWNTATEKNNAGFEVQVSTNGSSFRKLQFVEPASANSNSPRSYVYNDVEAGKTGLRYYRLRQVDLDGKASFSPVRTVDFGKLDGTSLTAMPNPFSAQLMLNVQTRTASPATLLTVTDATGRTILTQTLALPAGQSQVTINDLERLPVGMYLLHLTLDGQLQHVKVVKK
ncbi:BNR-repeat neuraminidase N-terminal domain-containing protein [Hymenobacter sp. ASUV-10]|uniref:BNR-repeat neuraminidase N-terminal domain-containing protein n=1 Tax=Hymenobacter aranciens TaxID=3063996 RepID=A0ABT9B5G5_9BACT|nr:BNR-repeat neuraminidase N-terminal domain-containing protein [Hymenobacter sp. ASUV-10]MDO7873392.1 BNR-repeat neuraminidase N-terminal domain-containing protein [Hymenobacter sp. ASUV-10]